MAKKTNKRLSPKLLRSDKTTFEALAGITAYAPANPQFSMANVKAIEDAMLAARTNETVAEGIYKAARDQAAASEVNFHNAILGVKSQVKAQFGEDSDEVQAIGLKKKSEFKSRKTKKKKGSN